MTPFWQRRDRDNSTLAYLLISLGLTAACADTTDRADDTTTNGGATATGGATGKTGTTATGGATGKTGTAATGGASAPGGAPGAGGTCYTAPRDPSLGGALSVYGLYPKNLCYVPGTAAGAGGVASCAATAESTLLKTLSDANPPSISSIQLEWVIEGPTVSADASQCCYEVCMSFTGI